MGHGIFVDLINYLKLLILQRLQYAFKLTVVATPLSARSLPVLPVYSPRKQVFRALTFLMDSAVTL